MSDIYRRIEIHRLIAVLTKLLFGGYVMAWYFIADTYINEEKGRGEYDEYINAVKPIVESYGGKYLVRTENLQTLSGERNPQRIIVVRFEDKSNLEACFASDEYNMIVSKRKNNVDSRAVIAEGI